MARTAGSSAPKTACAAMQEELIDRFGELPAQAQALIETHRLRIAGKAVGVARLDAGPASFQLQVIPNPPVDPAGIIRLVQSDRAFRLAGPDKLVRTRTTSGLKERASAAREPFDRLRPKR